MSFHVEIPDDRYYQKQIRCQSACPVGTDSRGYVRAIAEGDFETAYLIARAPNPLASICGRVCGAPCEASCRRGFLDAPVSIRALKRAAAERCGAESEHFDPLESLRRLAAHLGRAPSGRNAEGPDALCDVSDRLGRLLSGEGPGAGARRVAIIGSGPAGLACAHDLALLGHHPVVFELEDEPASLLINGIPEFRLPRHLIRAEVAAIRALGVTFRCGTHVGRDIGFDRLLVDHDAVVVAVGACRSRRIPLPGVEGPGVTGALEFLREASRDAPAREKNRRVVVVGGGGVAYDAARTALREDVVEAVTLISLESLEEMPASDAEIREGEEEGLELLNAMGPEEILRDEDGRVCGIVLKRCVRVTDGEGRFAPEYDRGDLTRIPCDRVILAVGQSVETDFLDPERDGVRLSAGGTIETDPESLATSRAGVFAAGDATRGPGLLIHAIAGGKRVARSVHRYLTGEEPVAEAVGLFRPLANWQRERGYEALPRSPVPIASPAERLRSPAAQVELGFDDARARSEAARCFDCSVNPRFDGTRCLLCGGCVEVCPESCLKIVSFDRLAPAPELERLREALRGKGAEAVSAILKDEKLCLRCALCAEHCPGGAITMERFCLAPAPGGPPARSATEEAR